MHAFGVSRQHQISKPADPERMHDQCLSMLPQPDNAHLQEATLVGTMEVGVGLDPAENNSGIRLGGSTIEVQRVSEIRTVELHDLHARAHRHADGRFGDAVGLQKRLLTGRRCATVTSHGRHDERMRPPIFEPPDGGTYYERKVGDSPTPDRNGHPHARTNLRADSGQFVVHGLWNVLNRRSRKQHVHRIHLDEPSALAVHPHSGSQAESNCTAVTASGVPGNPRTTAFSAARA